MWDNDEHDQAGKTRWFVSNVLCYKLGYYTNVLVICFHSVFWIHTSV